MPDSPATLSVDVASLGVQLSEKDGSFFYRIQVYAPSASAVYLAGDSFGWEIGRPMSLMENGVWETSYTAKAPLDGQGYKFRIVNGQRTLYRPDPFAKSSETSGGKASLFSHKPYLFGDSLWRRQTASGDPAPMHIYGIDFTLFEEKSLFDLVKNALPHLKSLSVTHILLPAMKEAYPALDIGGDDDTAKAVELCHQNGVGVLMTLTDFLPHSLRDYDGSSLFERKDDPERLDLSDPFCAAYLDRIAKAFVTRYHIDGFSLALGDKTPSVSTALRSAFPSLFLLTDRPCPEADLVWDKARQKALDEYFACDPYFRKGLHSALSLPEEGRLLPENEGEEVSRMSLFFGSYEDKFAANRLYSTLAAFTGRQLYSFSANELAPFDRKSHPQWFMLSYETHRRFLTFRKALGFLYQKEPALSGESPTLLYESGEDNLLALKKGELIALFNCSAAQKELTLWMPKPFTLLLHSDSVRYGGATEDSVLASYPVGEKTLFELPPLSAVIIKTSQTN